MSASFVHIDTSENYSKRVLKHFVVHYYSQHYQDQGPTCVATNLDSSHSDIANAFKKMKHLTNENEIHELLISEEEIDEILISNTF